MELITAIYSKAIVYNVKPEIFVFIYVITIPVYYLGWGIVAEEGLKYYRKRKLTSRDICWGDFFSEKVFLWGFVINRIGWFAPYGYVIAWGRNLPPYIYAFIFVWLVVSSYFLINKIHRHSDKRHAIGVVN